MAWEADYDCSSVCLQQLMHTVRLYYSLLPPVALPSQRTQRLCADVSFLLHYTLATHPSGHRPCVCVCVGVFPLESFQVPRCHPADQTSRRKARCFSAPSAAAAASLLEAGAKDAKRRKRLMRPCVYTSQAYSTAYVVSFYVSTLGN